jgi:beta-1,4-galactosyltransferase 1
MKGVIIIPYRNRKEHLKIFLENFKELGLDIFVIEQCDDKLFNRGKLLNIGFKITENDYDYFIFHDVDMIPFKNIDYSYSSEICHMARKVEQFNYKIPYEGYFGGVTLFPKDKFIEINGFSNNYWGWGQEDDNLYHRCQILKLSISHRDIYYKSLKHKHGYIPEIFQENVKKSEVFNSNPDLMFEDGLSSLSDYTLINHIVLSDYTLIQIKNN